MRIRSHLLLLASVVLVPGFLSAIIAVEEVRSGQREAGLQVLRETVRATALLVDGEVQRSLGALTALGNSPSLQSGDLRAFYDEARAIDHQPDVWTLLLDDTGAQRMNTSVPFGTSLPQPASAAKARIDRVLAEGKPLVTDVIVGPVTKALLTTIYAPAKAAPAGRFVVAQAFSVERWKKTALQSSPHPEWLIGVLDRNGKFISRSKRTDELLGRSARPELVAAAAASNEGLVRHRTLEGIDSYDAFTHSTLTGWTIAVAAPVDTIEASATQAVAWLAGGVAFALATALIGASLLGRTLMRAIDTASAAARTLGRGARPVRMATAIDEVDVLHDALVDAGALLASERDARETVEAERGRLLDNERDARESAQRENAAKDQFLALLGHELRNPLAAIAGATEVLARGRHDADAQQRYLGIVQRQNRHLRHIVDDLLDISRMLSNKVTLELRPLDLADCVSSCVEALRTTERAAGYELRLDASPVWIRGDSVRLEQVVNNLVGNALKFSPAEGAVRIDVGARDGAACLEVADAGSGIPPSLLPHVFEPFVQGPAFPGRQASGLGIGLALVRQLVELHGGTIVAHSEGAGRGARFVVTLPRIAETSAAQDSAVEVRSGRRVLLVEDNVDARQAMAELLRIEGYAVIEAPDGDEALRAALAERPDVVVMDLGLPGRGGLEIATQMKRDPALAELPLIALSGYGQASDRAATSAAGFGEHLVKPVELDDLVRAIERAGGVRPAG